MKKTRYILISIMLLTALLPSCATIERPEVKTIKEKPKISKTIQQEKISIGAKKGLKRNASFTDSKVIGIELCLKINLIS